MDFLYSPHLSIDLYSKENNLDLVFILENNFQFYSIEPKLLQFSKENNPVLIKKDLIIYLVKIDYAEFIKNNLFGDFYFLFWTPVF